MSLLDGVCSTPVDEHDDDVRPYIDGPHCTRHAPWSLRGLPAPAPYRAPQHAPRRASLDDVDADRTVPGKRATSHAAARKALPRSGTQRRAVLDALYAQHLAGNVGATDLQLAQRLGLDGNSVRPRRGELVELWLVRDSGKRVREHGTDHIVWAVTNDAVTLLRRHPAPAATTTAARPASAWDEREHVSWIDKL